MSKRNSQLSYPIFVGDIYADLDAHIFQMQPKVSKIYILVDENTHTNCIPNLIRSTSTLAHAEILEIESGEDQKNIEICYHLWQTLAENNADRNTLLINLGGGVITDMGGFIASSYKRGIRFINIPTSLLAMVDAAVGGKTGIDLGVFKNHIGSFYNPEAVFVNPDFLETLAKKEFISGMGEILKYSLIDRMDLWEEFKKTHTDNSDYWNNLIDSSLEIKTRVVKQDPKENGLRKILNFGHTYGHAFESLSLQENPAAPLSHGEAVALGIICELWHSVEKLNFPISLFNEIKEYIFQNFRVYPIKVQDIESIINLMKKDKKNQDQQIAIVLLKSIGEPQFDAFINEQEISDCLNFFISQ